MSTVQDVAAPAAAPSRGRPSPPRRSRRRVTWLAVAPAAVLLVTFVGYPIVDSLRLSFTRWGGLGTAHWTGLSNYNKVLSDGAVAHATWVTAELAVLSAAGIMVIATVLAATVSSGVGGSGVYRIAWFLPGIAPVTAVGIFWSQSVAPGQGAVNVVLGSLGLGDMHTWLADPDTAIYPVAAATVWAGVGFAFLLVLGATEQIPVEVYEAARLDGAGTLRQFFSITLPLIRPVLTITTMLELVWAANGFTMVYAMTAGGPGDATTTLPVLIYKQAFQFTDYGTASTMAVLSGLVLTLLGLVAQRVGTSKQEA